MHPQIVTYIATEWPNYSDNHKDAMQVGLMVEEKFRITRS